ncbi:hypothetical protein DY000_02058350 [Brassica cretica]|uniref:Uncharacterized protein n=1 Tax=Brassica cretica TaxID=69181 RepID=A0ABQ7AG43_BRACR|nr:hypothetical protein DY000_02058350 [Brassica cretica]
MHYNSDSIIHEEIDCEQANEKQLELCVFWSLFLSEGELVEAMDRRDLRKMLIDPGSTDSVVLEVKVWPQAIPDRSFDLVDEAAKAFLWS